MVFRDQSGTIISEGDRVAISIGSGQLVDGVVASASTLSQNNFIIVDVHLPLLAQPDGAVAGILRLGPAKAAEPPASTLVTTE